MTEIEPAASQQIFITSQISVERTDFTVGHEAYAETQTPHFEKCQAAQVGNNLRAMSEASPILGVPFKVLSWDVFRV